MSTNTIYIIVAVIVVVYIAATILIAISPKYKKLQQDKKELLIKLEKTRQQEKYAKQMTVNTYLKAACYIVFVLSALLLIFLPVFKMEIVEGYSQNFSYFDNYTDLKNATTDDRHFTDIQFDVFVFIIMLFLMLLPLLSTIKKLQTVNPKWRAEYYARYKLKIPENYIEPLIFFGTSLIIPIMTIVIFKNAKFDFSSDYPYTITEMGRYLIYDVSNSNITFSVYRNNFKFYSGVSGFIAIPIIIALLGVALMALNIYRDHKLRQQIIEDDAVEDFEDSQGETELT